jgi:hypothetical protein
MRKSLPWLALLCLLLAAVLGAAVVMDLLWHTPS